MGRRLSAYLPLHVAHHKGLAFLFDGKIKDNEMRCAILNDPHTIMYMPIEPNESIKAFMTRGKNKIIESFTQHLSSDSWI